MSFTEFIKENIAPYTATKIGVYDSSGNRVGEIPLGTFKPEFGERSYRFGLLSDVHNQSDQTAESTEDLQRALEFFNNKESVIMTCICGDITQNGTSSEYAIYQNNVNAKSPNTPVYTTVGNHDATTSGLDETSWNTYTGHDRCFTITQGTDTFVFFGMKYWSLGSSGTPYLDTDIDWLEEQLDAHRNERVFVFTHLFFPTRAGNLNDIYPTGNWLGGDQLTRIQALNDKYKNSIWFTGHSHWKWYLQKYQDRANIYRSNCGWNVHVPSCASPIDSDGSSRESKPLESEGAIVDVYADYIDIRGMDLKNQKYLPIAHYRLDTMINYVMSKYHTDLTATASWELGSFESTTGALIPHATANYNCIRSSSLIPLNSSKSYYLTLINPIEVEDDDTSLKEISIGLYDSSQNYLGRANGVEEDSPYFINSCIELDVTENIFGAYPNAAYARLKGYRNSSTKTITVEFGNQIILVESGSSSGEGEGGESSSIPDGYQVLTADDFTIRNGSPTITTDSEGYIVITFTASSQKFWVKPSNFSSSTATVTTYIEDVIFDPSTNTTGVGFYKTDTNYGVSTGLSLLIDSTNGVQFNISGSKYTGSYPITVKMKNVALKCE